MLSFFCGRKAFDEFAKKRSQHEWRNADDDDALGETFFKWIISEWKTFSSQRSWCIINNLIDAGERQR